jgi:hypothetical protein
MIESLLLTSPDDLFQYEQRMPALELDPPQALAHAIAASPGWPAGCAALIVARRKPASLLAVVGRFDRHQKTWLLGQAASLRHSCSHLRYISADQAQEDCRVLAEKLRSFLGPEGIAKAQILAIPRGGLFVQERLQGLLSLKQRQMSPPFSARHPLVVVDDCALSGARFRQILRDLSHPAIVFAHLYSPAGLRSAIESREPRVTACLWARDVAGRPLAASPAADPSDRFYWSGQTEALCFPWNEPDRTFWNPAAERWDLAWRIVPPELCSKNRPQPGTAPIPIQIQPEGRGPLRPSERALFATIEGATALFDLTTGQGFSLAGTASDLWHAVVRLGDLDAAVAELGRDYDAPEATVRSDAQEFVEDLLARGLLERCATAPVLAA